MEVNHDLNFSQFKCAFSETGISYQWVERYCCTCCKGKRVIGSSDSVPIVEEDGTLLNQMNFRSSVVLFTGYNG